MLQQHMDGIMSNTLLISVDNDHIKKEARSSNIYEPLFELIWNALDADATDISIITEKNEALGCVETIRVIDNGHSMAVISIDDYFGKFGNKHKERDTTSPLGRFYHGKKGFGRFKVLSICDNADWNFSIKGDKLLSITISSDDPRSQKWDTLEQCANNTFTEVVLTDLKDKIGTSYYDDERLINKIASSFCIYLSSYFDTSISLNGKQLNIAKYIKATHNNHFVREIKNIEYDFDIRVIEIESKSDDIIYLCNEHGMVLSQRNSGIKLQVNFVCYIMSRYFSILQNESLIDTELDSNVQDVIDIAIDFMKSLVRYRKASIAKELVDKLKSQKVYPYPDIVDPILQTEKDIFDIVVSEIDNTSSMLKRMNIGSKKVTLSLMKEVLSHNPQGLFSILEEVFKLDQNEMNKFVSLIGDISLPKFINLSSTINDRLKILEAFNLFLFDPELNKKVKERAQLQKLLEDNLWIFGDQYQYGTSDQSLKNLLLKHLSILDRDTNELDIENLNELNDIPDIFIYQQYPSNIDQSRYKNLIIEIKRPSKLCGIKELNQIKSYANAVMDDNLFDKENTYWEFILLSTRINNDISYEINQEAFEKGVARKGKEHIVRVIMWSEILQSCKGRLEFLRKQLDKSYNKDEVVEHLKQCYPYFSDL